MSPDRLRQKRIERTEIARKAILHQENLQRIMIYCEIEQRRLDEEAKHLGECIASMLIEKPRKWWNVF